MDVDALKSGRPSPAGDGGRDPSNAIMFAPYTEIDDARIVSQIRS
jgi:hypothetical protein